MISGWRVKPYYFYLIKQNGKKKEWKKRKERDESRKKNPASTAKAGKREKYELNGIAVKASDTVQLSQAKPNRIECGEMEQKKSLRWTQTIRRKYVENTKNISNQTANGK